jgi:hypothetical protein
MITVMSGISTRTVFLGFQFPYSLLWVCVLVGKTSGLERCELRFTGSCEQTFELLEMSTGKVVNSLSELILLYLRLRKQRQGWCRGSGYESPASQRRSWSTGSTAAICGAGSVLDSAGTSLPKYCVCVVLTPVMRVERPTAGVHWQPCESVQHRLRCTAQWNVISFGDGFWDHRMKIAYVDWNRLSQVHNRRVPESTRQCPK